MLPDKKTVLFILGLAAVIVTISHFALNASTNSRKEKAYKELHDGLLNRSADALPKLTTMLSDKPNAVIALTQAGATGGTEEYGMLHQETSSVITFRAPANAKDPTLVAATLARLSEPAVTAYDPTNGVVSGGMMMHVMRLPKSK